MILHSPPLASFDKKLASLFFDTNPAVLNNFVRASGLRSAKSTFLSPTSKLNFKGLSPFLNSKQNCFPKSFRVMSMGGPESSSTPKVIVLTGVSKGLGKALAIELASRGHTIAGCSRSKDKINHLQEVIGEKHFLSTVDVSSDDEVKEFAKHVMQKYGAPDIIVNNAGVINQNAKLWQVPKEEFDEVIDVNIKGTANFIRNFVPLMLPKQKGIIVNFSSGWGRSVSPQVAPYCASKWAVEGLTKALASELPPGMVTVALNPGVINTDMLKSCFGSSASMYTSPDSWAPQCASLILNLMPKDNGSSLTV